MPIALSFDDDLASDEVMNIYNANNWSSAKNPDALMSALRNSYCILTARLNGKLVGLANAISDGSLVVYYPHVLVHPEYQHAGIGKRLMEAMVNKHADMHQQVLLSVTNATLFYEKLGFRSAKSAKAMWIYDDDEE